MTFQCLTCKKEVASLQPASTGWKTLYAMKHGFCSWVCMNEKIQDDWKFEQQVLRNQERSNEVREAIEKQGDKEFYYSREWRELRFLVLKAYHKCLLCGARDKLQVDHIKPRSKYPELALERSNLQVLCEDCNLGKSNKHEDDFREIIF